MLRQLIFCIALIFFSIGTSHAQGVAESDVSRIMKKARSDAEKITIPVNKYSEQGLKVAEDTANLFHSPEFQKRVQCEQQRLEKEVFTDFIKPWKKKIRQMTVIPQGSDGNLGLSLIHI